MIETFGLENVPTTNLIDRINLLNILIEEFKDSPRNKILKDQIEILNIELTNRQLNSKKFSHNKI